MPRSRRARTPVGVAGEDAPYEGLVDVTVITQDAWSREPGGEAGNKGGVSTFGASLTDTNLAGLGRQLTVSYNKGVDRSRAAIDYRDPSFIRPYWLARATYAQNSDGFRADRVGGEAVLLIFDALGD